LQAGQTYELVWENLDGVIHNFIIEDADRNELVTTEDVTEQGATASVSFEATEAMSRYYCEYHPQSMAGTVEVGAAQTTTTTDESPTRYSPEGPTVATEIVGEGLTAPTAMAVAPGVSDRRFVTDQTSQVYIHGPDGFLDEPLVDVSDRIVIETDGYDERGLLGIEFHPDFQSNGLFYLHYSVPPREGTPPDFDHTEVVAEFATESAGPDTDPGLNCVLLEIPSPQTNHDAGPIAFGPDGYRYVPMGDGGGTNDTGLGHVSDWYDENEGGNGQDLKQNLLGGILRIDVDDTAGEGELYAIPGNNPLVGKEGLDEYYAWGMRNPLGISFDSEGRLFVADAGQNLFEEVNLVEKGGNYAWNVQEATPASTPPTRTNRPIPVRRARRRTSGAANRSRIPLSSIPTTTRVNQSEPSSWGVTSTRRARSRR